MKTKKKNVVSKPGKKFHVTVELVTTNEKFGVDCESGSSTTVGKFKSLCELFAGIPSNIQRLNYLDEEELPNDNQLAFYDMVSGAKLRMKFWNHWNSLIEAVVSEEIDEVMKLGVTVNRDFKSPILQHMSDQDQQKWLADRAFVALFVAAHRNQLQLCQKLIASGANTNSTTPSGRTALHAAAAMGHSNVINCLLEGGADINSKDADGLTAMDLAKKLGHKGCERQLIQFAWNKRAKGSTPTTDVPLFAHQYFDSSLKTFLHGDQAQMYCQTLLPPGEFEGTSLNAPRRKIKSGASRSAGENTTSVESREEVAEKEKDTDSCLPGNVGEKPNKKSLVSTELSAKRGSKVDSFRDWLINSEEQPDRDNSPYNSPTLLKKELCDDSMPMTNRTYEMEYDMVETKLVDGDTANIVQAVIAKKLKDQKERGLSGLPYDLWLASRDNTELYLAVKDRGQLNALMKF